MPSMMIFTARPPIASIGCRTVVSDGAERNEGATSSKPVTEHCSGTLTPAFVRRRSRQRRQIVEGHQRSEFLRRWSSSSAIRKPLSKLDVGSTDSGSCWIKTGSISSPRFAQISECRANAALSISVQPSDECDLTVTQLMQVLEREPRTDFVIDHHRTDDVARKLPANRRRGNVPFGEIAQELNVDEEPVGNHDQGFNMAFEQHLEVSLEAIPLVVRVSENRDIRSLIERIFDSSHDQCAKRVRNVEEHHADALMRPLAARAGHGIRAVLELARNLFNAFLGRGSDSGPTARC